MSSFICGSDLNQDVLAQARREAVERGYDEEATSAIVDYFIHHRSGYSHSSVGILDNDGNVQCVGCCWCEGPHTQAHSDVERPR